MSDVIQAASILANMSTRRLMNYQINQDSQEGLEQSWLQWPYSNLQLPQYNAMPIGYYPTLPPINPQYWIPSTTPYMPDTVAYPYLQGQGFPGMEYQANMSWAMFPHQQAYADTGQNNRRRRHKFTNEEVAVLEESFTNGSKFPSPSERMQLESKTGLSKEKISVWFQNRRAKEKREKGHDEGSKESTTTDSELETEDERQLSIYDETPEEDSEIEDTQKHQSNISSDFKQTYPVDIPIKTRNDIILPRQGETGGLTSSNMYHSKIDETQNRQYIKPSNIKAQHHEIVSTNASTNIKLPRPEVKASSTLYLPCLEGNGNVPGGVIRLPPQEGTNVIDSKELYHREIHEITNHKNNINSDEPHQENHSTKPSFMIRSLPCGRIAVESSEQCLEENEETQNHPNIPSEVELTHPTSIFTNTLTETYVPQPGGIVAVDITRSYCSDTEDSMRNNQSKTTRDAKRPHPTNISETTLAEIKVPDPGGTIAIDVSRAYQGENRNSPSVALPIQLTTSSHDENPRKRVISKTGSIDEKSDVIATDDNSNDVINNVKKDIDVVENSEKSGFDDFRFQNKKGKTSKDIVSTTTVTTPGNTSLEYRMFGET